MQSEGGSTMSKVTMAAVVNLLRTKGEKDSKPNPRGNTVYRMFLPEDRYVIDFADDFAVEGWQQFDTDQDASYFGVWVNKAKRLTLNYTEGDWVLVECPTEESYRAEIVGMCEFYGEGRIARVIDAGAPAGFNLGRVTDYVQDRAKLFLS
jgi:hypothetical protein